MNLYAWLLAELVRNLLPAYLRQLKRMAWLESLLAPADDIQQDFVRWGQTTLYALDFTGQVISLERRLNDEFDPVLRRIYLSDDAYIQESFLFRDATTNSSEETEFLFYDGTHSSGEAFWLYQDGYAGEVDFYVNVPASLAYDAPRLTALVHQYKMAGKRFALQTF